MKKFILILICTLAPAHSEAASFSAFAQLTRTAAALQAPLPAPAPATEVQCLLKDGSWSFCPGTGRWDLPGSAQAYLVDGSSRTYFAKAHPPRSVIYLTEHYAAEPTVKNAVLSYCSGAAAGLSEACAFASQRTSKAIFDGTKVYLAGAERVVEFNDPALMKATAQLLADSALRVRGGEKAEAAVGCAMQEKCWGRLGYALDSYTSWAAAQAAKAEDKKS